jgi:Uma2 family endonuclease
MAPERARHAEVKFAVQTALAGGIRAAGLPCHMLPDGMTVRIDAHTAHEPDALVYCGPKLSGSVIEVPEPMILIEVLSPTTRHIDASAKLGGYFGLPSTRHYLIVDPDRPMVIDHARGDRGEIATRIMSEGTLRLDPPGIELAIGDFYPNPA